MSAFAGLRNHDNPGIVHLERLAAGGAIDVRVRRKTRRVRDRIGDAAVVVVLWGLILGYLIAF
jgi:hypothetical protein